MIFFKFLKVIFTTLLLLLLPIFLYISTAYLFSLFPSKSTASNNKDKNVYLLYDDVHSDLAFNLEEVSEEWIKNLPLVKNKTRGYIAFGWGDKETYLNTPTWDNLKTSTALKALFIKTPSLMHVSYYHDIIYFTGVKVIKIDKNQSQTIKESIFKSFNFKEKWYKGYGKNDIFYTSPYKYTLFNTCNAWTGETLRDANVSMSYWTPFTHNIINALP